MAELIIHQNNTNGSNNFSISLDEAFLDVTNNKKGIELAVDIAKEIKARIKAELNLTASAGVSYNKFLAKIASDYRKPDGLCTVHPDMALDFVAKLPVDSQAHASYWYFYRC